MISLIATVLNERDNIEDFINSILNQTKKPDEVIIVDGGSTDGTQDIIRRYPEITLITQPGANISKGRNIAIRHAKGDIILSTDAGCVLDKTWVEKISTPFEDEEVEVVGGYYYPLVGGSKFERAQAVLYLSQRPGGRFFTPSSRSIGFRKYIWEKVGGYPEWLDIGEDTYFNMAWSRIGAKYVFIKDAVVYWKMRKGWISFIKQHFRYGRGSGLGGDMRPFLLYPVYIGGLFLFGLSFEFPVIFLFLIPAAFLYFFVFRLKKVHYIKEAGLGFLDGVFLVFILDLVRAFSTIAGHLAGLFKRLFSRSFS